MCWAWAGPSPAHAVILARGRSVLHLSVLEALYIHKLSPELCVQKENVLSLQLLGANPRESVRNASSY